METKGLKEEAEKGSLLLGLSGGTLLSTHVTTFNRKITYIDLKVVPERKSGIRSGFGSNVEVRQQ